jgi:dGTP triphosphohydrolase
MSNDLVEAQVISNTTEVYSEIKSICCDRLQQEFEAKLLELKTARTIIQLLQEEVNSRPRSISDNTRGRNIRSVSNSSND